MVGLYRDRTGGSRWLNLCRLRPQLAGIGRVDQLIRIGASTTMTELRSSSLLDEVCPLIGQAAAAVGAVQIQNRATVGGNIANSSPAGDTLASVAGPGCRTGVGKAYAGVGEFPTVSS